MSRPTPTPPLSHPPRIAPLTHPEAGAVGQPHPHESATLHVSGEARYTDDIAELHGTLHAALGLSQQAHARVLALNLDAVRAAPGVVAVFTARDIPGLNDCGPILHDDPILADGLVQYIGQPMFLVVACSHDAARRAARLAVVEYQPLPALLSLQAAKAAQAFVLPPMRLQRGNTQAALDRAAHRLSGNFSVGGQEQFYLEGQIAYAVPQEHRGIHVHSSTQHPTEMQHLIAQALCLSAHDVQVTCRRMGGGFGGKESQSALWACCAALAAMHLQRPVKLRADRDDDMLVTGKRHDFEYDYEVGFDTDGRILGARIEMRLRAGFSADLTGPVATRAICHVDNAYYLPNVDITALCCKTHTQSNTAFRGFGGPQGAIVIENILDSIARQLQQDPLDIRRRNFYGSPSAPLTPSLSRNCPDQIVDESSQHTPYGQVVEDNVIHELVTTLEASSDYQARRQTIRVFNATSPILKKGLALTPVKFGISFNVPHFNQAGALVHLYTDGSVLVNHGGTEMGQGLHTKIAQVVAHELGIPLEQVRTTATDTAKIANTSATAASTGSDLNGKAVQQAAHTLRQRLTAFAAEHYGIAAQDVGFANGQVMAGEHTLPFADLLAQAYRARIQLWADGFYSTPRIHWDAATMTGHPFYYFAYGAAVSEILLDTLTGEWKLLRVDALYDAGHSLNPAVDLGQVEGGFIQGMGWLTSEELHWDAQGRLRTHAPSTYKIPTVSDCPADFRVTLYSQANPAETIHGSKAAGEPPLLLAFSVFFALRDAISNLGHDGIDPPLHAPATPEALLAAITTVRHQIHANTLAPFMTGSE